ncbi:MAG: response regulator [Spirochaetales bacterium]|jgi:CheY-like chemotaxis protein|nr:response regulator [Spirochaetales bacterium]
MKSKTKILIVDDELINLDFFSVMFSKLGFEVEEAENGEEALEKTKKFLPDLIILDNIMPKLSGWEVTKILKRNDEFSDVRHIPIIMLSAMDDVKDKIEGFELGIEDYITKPFNFSEVLVRIKAVLRHKDFAEQIARRENRLALSWDLNRSLEECVQKVKGPFGKLLREVKKPGAAKSADCVALIEEAQAALALVEKAGDEIARVGAKDRVLKEGEISLQDLNEQYNHSHFDGA